MEVFSERLPEIWIRHTITDPCIDCKKQTMQGLFYERLYWRAGNRDCKLHYTREGNNPADSKKIRSVKIDCTYSGNKIELKREVVYIIKW